MHTPLCQHAAGSPVEYARAAVAKGLGEIGFSDHAPMPVQYDEWRMAPDELPQYFALVQEAKEQVSELSIKLALEVDYIKGYEEHIRWLQAQAPFDYLIGSVHYITPDWDVDNPSKLERWKEQPVAVTWEQYYKCVTASAESGFFDIIGHPDLCKKFAHVPGGNLDGYYREPLDAIADHKLCIELNTSGRHKPVAEAYPSRRFLEMALQREIPLVINSDAHTPDQVGRDFEWAKAFVWEVGYRELQRFDQRERMAVSLADW